jgi:lambda family phage tail tape measure protein
MQRIKDAKVEQAEWDAKQNERQVGYTAVFKSSFESMGDAIMEFAKTGKLNFKSLINDMIAGLVKLELKMAMTRMMEGMGGFGGLASKAISFLTGAPGGASTLGPEASSLELLGMAKGAAYDDGIKKFAMGGTFSNSIVSSPTLFKFASGAGLMGEAGPEAIMPLKRDPQGNLGVRGGSNGGGNVEVVVNNFGSEKATTKETTDSKGNRKIEVVIGDLSAGEITRSGSSSQRAIRSTFGMQPQLIRR